MTGPLSSKEDRNNEAYSQGYDDGRNEDNPISRLSNSIARDIGKSDEAECYRKGYDKGCEDRSEHGTQSDDSSSSSESSGCFLTTACVQHAGLPDNCVELETMRSFRDNFILRLPEGSALVAEYYRTAPGIVRRISGVEERNAVLQHLLSKVREAVALISDGRESDALVLCRHEFAQLLDKYPPKSKKEQ